MDFFENIKKIGVKSLDSGVEIAKKLLQYQEKIGSDAIKVGKDALKYINNISEKGKDQGVSVDENGDISFNFEKLVNSLNKEEKALFEISLGTMHIIYDNLKKEYPEMDNSELEKFIIAELNKSLAYTKIKDYVEPPAIIDKYKTLFDVFCELTEEQQMGYNAILSFEIKNIFDLPIVTVKKYVQPINHIISE